MGAKSGPLRVPSTAYETISNSMMAQAPRVRLGPWSQRMMEMGSLLVTCSGRNAALYYRQDAPLPTVEEMSTEPPD